jgi:pimeloyl-ACP methyl ester carboxylesterase
MIAATIASLALAASPTPTSEPVSAGKLGGTLVMPAKPLATMLIIPGSGPTDRDGNNPLGVKGNSYKLFAEALAEKRIATVRIAKRGMFTSRGAVADANQVTIADYVADTQAWVQVAKARTGASCVWLAGHSEGGLIALASAGKPNVCGLVLLAAAGRPTGTLIREQLRANPANAPLLEQAERAIAELEAGRRTDTSAMHPALGQGLFNPAVQGYLIDLMSHDPVDLARRVRVPLLIVQGDNDIQVTAADARALHQAQPKSKLLIIEGMNHLLKPAPRDPAGNAATYVQPELPLAEGLVDAVVAFVKDKR